MPSKSPAQAKLMQAAAHNSQFALKAGVPPSVAKKFVAADKAKGPPKKVGQFDLPVSKKANLGRTASKGSSDGQSLNDDQQEGIA
jgi:hypothetical protein